MGSLLPHVEQLYFDSLVETDNDGLLRILARAIPNLDYLYLELDEHNSFSNTGLECLGKLPHLQVLRFDGGHGTDFSSANILKII
eukprot:jgi/Tetstr1/441528/TSEL_029758.t1